MLIAMVVIFAICWLPLNIVHMMAEFHRSDLKHYKALFLSTHVIAMSSTIYNPFLYSWLNDNFRKEFQEIIPCLFKLCSCFHGDRLLAAMQLPDGDMCHDRPSTNHMQGNLIFSETINGFATRTIPPSETVQLELITRYSLVQEPLLQEKNQGSIDANGNNC